MANHYSWKQPPQNLIINQNKNFFQLVPKLISFFSNDVFLFPNLNDISYFFEGKIFPLKNEKTGENDFVFVMVFQLSKKFAKWTEIVMIDHDFFNIVIFISEWIFYHNSGLFTPNFFFYKFLSICSKIRTLR